MVINPEMAAYDALSPEVRAALQDADFNWPVDRLPRNASAGRAIAAIKLWDAKLAKRRPMIQSASR